MIKVEVVNIEKTLKQVSNIIRLYYESCYNAAEKTMYHDYAKNIQPYYNKYTPKKTGKLRRNKQATFKQIPVGTDTIKLGDEIVYSSLMQDINISITL